MEERKLSQEQISKAVEWWGNAIRSPKFDNGDNSDQGGMTMMLAHLASSKHNPTDEQIETFKKNLEELMKNDRCDISRFGLFCDYGPDATLGEAAKKSGISELVFPWKTGMWFRDGKVVVQHGYRNGLVEL